MAVEQDINLNMAKCLQSATDWGVTHVHNICTGKISDVPWGSVDWVFACGVFALGVVFVLVFGGMAVSIIRD